MGSDKYSKKFDVHVRKDGGSFKEYAPLMPLFADKFNDQWIEIRSSGQMVYHVPLFFTPDPCHSNYTSNSQVNQLGKAILINEDYKKEEHAVRKYKSLSDLQKSEIHRQTRAKLAEKQGSSFNGLFNMWVVCGR